MGNGYRSAMANVEWKNPEYDENGDYVFRYKWDGKEVTNKKYEKKLKKLFGNRKPEALGNEAVSYHEIINQISHY